MSDTPFIVHWKLGKLLKAEGVSVYRLDQELAKQVGRSTLYRWSKAESAPDRPDLEALGWVLWGLEQITGKRYLVTDILDYERKEV